MTPHLKEDIVKNYDVLWLHYSAKVHPSLIGLWKHRYGLKIILDLDDSWNISLNHVAYKHLGPTIQRSKELSVIADHVVCSTSYVEEMVKNYNQNTSVIDNALPWGKHQYHIWQENKESFMKRKIRIGIVGSASHFEDWYSIKGKMRRVIKDGEIKKKCEFVIGGYNKANPTSQKKWEEVCSIFGNPIKVESREVIDYIDIYRNVDILLCPLVDNHSNRCRSNLKVFEAACVNSIPILGELYREKSPHNLAYPFEDWYNNIKRLISDKEKLYDLKHSLSQQFRDHHDYDELCVQPRAKVLDLPKPIRELNITGITYGNDQWTEYKEYRNKVNSIEEKSYLFEYNPMINTI